MTKLISAFRGAFSGGLALVMKLLNGIMLYFDFVPTRTKHQSQVMQFNYKARIPRPPAPAVPTLAMITARGRVIMEEALEVLNAMGIRVEHRGEELAQDKLVFISSTNLTNAKLPDLAKEFADLHVVTTSAEQAFGIDLKAVQEAVDANNLGKFSAGGYIDGNGKLCKPPGYPKPDIASVLALQGWKP